MEMQEANVDISIETPVDDAVKITLDRKVSPGGSALFTSLSDAEGWPLIEKLFQVGGVASVMARENELLVSTARDGDRDALISSLKNSIQSHYESDPDSHERTVMNDTNASNGSLEQKVQDVLESYINPGIAGHGGYIKLLSVEGTRVFLEMGGGCQGCAMAQATMKQGVERILKEKIPEITEVLDQTDHDTGSKPYC